MGENEDPISGMDPRDGFRILAHELVEREISLHVGLFSGGEIDRGFGGEEGSIQVTSWDHPTPDRRGDCTRLRLLLEAVCRFFNTGGTWEQFDRSIGVLRDAIPDGRFLHGYYYADGAVNTEGNYEHVFIDDSPSGLVVRWVEDMFVDPMTHEQFLSEPVDGGPSDETGLLGLPPGGDPGEEEEAPGAPPL